MSLLYFRSRVINLYCLMCTDSTFEMFIKLDYFISFILSGQIQKPNIYIAGIPFNQTKLQNERHRNLTIKMQHNWISKVIFRGIRFVMDLQKVILMLTLQIFALNYVLCAIFFFAIYVMFVQNWLKNVVGGCIIYISFGIEMSLIGWYSIKYNKSKLMIN